MDNFAGVPREATEPIATIQFSVAEVPTHLARAGLGPVFVKHRLIIPRFLTQRLLL